MAGTDLTEARKRAFRSWVQCYFDIELGPSWAYCLGVSLYEARAWQDLDERTLALASDRAAR